MSAILTNKTDLTPSAVQTPTGAVALTASGIFDGAKLVIHARADSQDWVEAYVFDKPGVVTLGFVDGHQWQASIENKGAKTSISLSSLSAA